MLKFNRKNSFIAIGVLVLFIAMLLIPPTGYVIPKYLTVRQSPNSSEIVYTLKVGDVVSILESDGNWVKIKKNRITGWVSGIYLLDSKGYRLYDMEIGVSREKCPTCWITNRTWFTPSPKRFTGRATFYAPNVMEAQVIRTAKRLGLNPNDYIGGVSTASASDIGGTIWLKREGSFIWEGPYLISDVSQRNHAWSHVGELGQAVEVDFETALRWGMVTTESGWKIIKGSLSNIRVYKGIIPSGGLFVDYKEWYRDMAEFALPRQPNWQWSPVYYFMNLRITY